MNAVAIRKLEKLVVTVTVTREFRVRLWLATKFFQLGARLLGGMAIVKHD